MKRKKTNSIIDELIDFQKSLENKPTVEEMFNQVKMMNFKFKPIQGSLINFNFKNKKFIEALWSLGKLDEFFVKKINSLRSTKEKEKFLNFFSQIYDLYQQKLNSTDLKSIEKQKNIDNILEVEISKKHIQKN